MRASRDGFLLDGAELGHEATFLLYHHLEVVATLAKELWDWYYVPYTLFTGSVDGEK